jgi:hypothetical protein
MQSQNAPGTAKCPSRSKREGAAIIFKSFIVNHYH